MFSVRIFWFATTACVTAWAWPEDKAKKKRKHLWQIIDRFIRHSLNDFCRKIMNPSDPSPSKKCFRERARQEEEESTWWEFPERTRKIHHASQNQHATAKTNMEGKSRGRQTYRHCSEFVLIMWQFSPTEGGVVDSLQVPRLAQRPFPGPLGNTASATILPLPTQSTWTHTHNVCCGFKPSGGMV